MADRQEFLSNLERDRTEKQGVPPIRVLLLTTAALGLCLTIYLIAYSGAAEVAHAMLVVGWWLVPITLFHLVPLAFSALSWRELLSAASRPGAMTLICLRWIRESINSLLPVASIGGDVASGRLAHLQGVPGVQAAAAIVVDNTIGVVTQLMFVLSGVVLLLMRSTERTTLAVAWAVLIGAGVFAVVIAVFVFCQHRGVFGGSAKLARRLLPEKWLSGFAPSAGAIDDAIAAAYRNPGMMVRANGLRLIGWAAGAGEIWLVMWSLGQPLGMVDAYVLESLGSGVRAAVFMVPGALGALEGSFVLFGALFGLSPGPALAISLSKRVRELRLGVPGLVAWHWIEAHHSLRQATPTR